MFNMLAVIGISLALYKQWFFSSTESITGATRDYFTKRMYSSCVQRRDSLERAEQILPQPLIITFGLIGVAPRSAARGA